MDSSIWNPRSLTGNGQPSTEPGLAANNNNNNFEDILHETTTTTSLDNDFYKNDDFLSSTQANNDQNDLLLNKLKLQSESAKLSTTLISENDLNSDDLLYKSAKIGGSDADDLGLGGNDPGLLTSSAALAAAASGTKVFNYSSTITDSKSYIRFSYKDIPGFLDLIFNKINSETSSNNKNSLIPAIVVFQMIRYSFYKRHNVNLTNNFLELFVNRIYLIIEDDSVSKIANNAAADASNDTTDKKQITIKKKNDIVLIAYWISVVNYLYYFLLRQEGFFQQNPVFLKKIIAVFNDLVNEFVNGITNRLDDIIDDCLINYSSIPNLQKGLLFQNDWNFFKNDKNKNGDGQQQQQQQQHNTFQEILDNLYPPDLKQQLKPSPIKFLQVLEAIIYVFQIYNISSIILKNLLARVLSWINAIVFNRVLGSNSNKSSKRKHLSRTSAIQLRLNLSIIEDWIRSISKNLQAEEKELNGDLNEVVFGEELKDVVKDYPDDLIDFKLELQGVSRFDGNARFFDAEEEQRKREVLVREREKQREEKEKQKEKEERQQQQQQQQQEKEKEKAKADEKTAEKDDVAGTENSDSISSKLNALKIDKDTILNETKLKNITPHPMPNIDDEDNEENQSVTSTSDEDNSSSYKNIKININTTPYPYISNFYYSPLYAIFKHNFRVLYNLLEFLQVGTTYMESIDAETTSTSAMDKTTGKKLSSKQIEEINESKFLEFLKRDIVYLNYCQIYHICKNYRYELNEFKFSKKFLKFLSKLAASSSNTAPQHTYWRFVNYNYATPGSSDELLFLSPTASSQEYPICMPTRQELINKYGAGARGQNKENLVKYQPWLGVEVRDLVDAVRDQGDYKENWGDSDDDDDDDDDNNNNNNNNGGADGYDDGSDGGAQGGFGTAGFGNGRGSRDDNDEDFFNLTAPNATAAKTWELNDHSTKAKSKKDIDEEVEIEYNPW